MQEEILLLEKGYKIIKTPDGGTEIYNPDGIYSGEVFNNQRVIFSNSSK